ncbi:cysteine synthase CysM [Aureibacter tunicatorum]|uniref:Cysteine synthase n=1 Tax=Aureibacter tunicatorum TaxID=866807 RepID=A0AAE3XQC4_9BACT|nr:cysteine synthase CysM [Aureibacter tunicatorum]MDR6239434.1 cysteine synthase B [Aureibacter tunicatorum]BDD04643.1 cysteine synthase B [Aureibacter tunicatorum]
MSDILKIVGDTPLVEIKSLNPNPKVRIFGKLEGNNPGGSVKDRAALGMIQGAIERGELKKGVKIIEATSGNTGIALAMIARLLGFEIELVMPENATKERVQTMEAYGAKVILTSKDVGMEGARDYAEEKVKEGGYLLLNQFANPDNFKAHYKSTGPEIWNATNGKVTHFVSSMGTTGTIMGVSRYLKEQNQNIQIVGVQPTEGANIPGIRRWPIEYLPKIFERERVDQIIDVSEEEAVNITRELSTKEGIFAGMSSGGAVAAALKLADQLEEGTIVCIICDRGDRYLSSDLFDFSK